MATDTEIVLVPYWILRSLKRKNLNIQTVLNYPQMRDVFSLEDLTDMLSLQSNSANSIVPISRYYEGRLLSQWEQSASASQKVELDSTIIPRSCSDDVRKDALSRLSILDPDDEESSPYEIVSVERGTVFVVVNPNFITHMGDHNAKLEFIRKILKVFYVYQTPKEVTYSGVFSDYVGLLNKTVWDAPSPV